MRGENDSSLKYEVLFIVVVLITLLLTLFVVVYMYNFLCGFRVPGGAG